MTLASRKMQTNLLNQYNKKLFVETVKKEKKNLQQNGVKTAKDIFAQIVIPLLIPKECSRITYASGKCSQILSAILVNILTLD